MRAFLLLCSLVVVSSPVSASTAGGVPSKVFQCSFGKKEVVVSRLGPLYLYSFGLPAHPEIQIVGDRKRDNVFSSGSFGTLDGDLQLRIANGRYSYVVFFNGMSDDYGTPRATYASGLAVFDGTKRISKLSCKSGVGFKSNWNENGGPPEDTDNYDVF